MSPKMTEIQTYHLKHPKTGMEAVFTNYGAILMSLKVADRLGYFDDIVLGFETPEDYQKRWNPYFGALAVGRYANRIAKGRFTLDGVEYSLATNNGNNHLHGGNVGFDKVVWAAREFTFAGDPAIEFTYTSPDGEEGYPGELTVSVRCVLNKFNELLTVYTAIVPFGSKATIASLTNHTYWNLAGDGEGDILAHELELTSDQIVEVDSELIPTGRLMPVEGTPFDFRTPHAIGERISDNHQQLVNAGGYDHCFVHRGFALDGSDKMLFEPHIATVYEPKSGREMKVYTNTPGVQLYCAMCLPVEGMQGKRRTYRKHGALCLETGYWPDSPNHPHFPSTVLLPSQTYMSTTTYHFETR